MKTNKKTYMVVFSLLTLLFLPSSMFQTANAQEAGDGAKEVVLKIEGMRCITCPATVKTALKRLPGVVDVEVSFKEKTATVKYEEDKVTVERLIKAVKDSGYGASVSPGAGGGS